MISVLIKEAKKFKQVHIGIVFVDSQTIKRLNKEYRGQAKPTTVLSFSQLEGQAFPQGGKEIYLGDVVICPPEAEKQGLDIEDLINHGLTNLLSEISTPESFRTWFKRDSRRFRKNLKIWQNSPCFIVFRTKGDRENFGGKNCSQGSKLP
jgi:rRNA maturation RNase YbeY